MALILGFPALSLPVQRIITVANGATQLTAGSTTLTWDEPVEAGLYPGGFMAYLVAPSGITNMAYTPAFDGASNGYSINVLGGQTSHTTINSYDARQATLTTPSGIGSLSAGDIVLICISRDLADNTGSNNRGGLVEEWVAVHVRASAPATNEQAPAVGGWSGRGAPSGTVIDLAARFAALEALTPLSTTGVGLPDPADLVTQLAPWNPVHGVFNSVNNGAVTHYEVWVPHTIPGYVGMNDEGTYGSTLCQVYEAATVILLTQSGTPAQRRAIFDALVHMGLQIVETFEGSGDDLSPNGGHRLAHIIPAMWYLYAAERVGDADTLFAPGALHGNLGQMFDVTAGAHLMMTGPHSDATGLYPRYNFLRTLPDQTGVAPGFFRAAFDTAGLDPKRPNYIDMLVVRPSDGARALINDYTGGFLGTGPAVTADYGFEAYNGETLPTFAQGDVVYFKPVNDLPLGWVGWRERPNDATPMDPTNLANYNAAPNPIYLNENYYAIHALLAAQIGMSGDLLDLAQRFSAIRMRGDWPIEGTGKLVAAAEPYNITAAPVASAVALDMTAALWTANAAALFPAAPAAFGAGDITIQLDSGDPTLAKIVITNPPAGTQLVLYTQDGGAPQILAQLPDDLDQASGFTVELNAPTGLNAFTVIAASEQGDSAPVDLDLDATPALTIAANDLSHLSYPPDVTGGAGQATITISGTATPGAVVEVLDYTTDGPSTWVTVATAGPAPDGETVGPWSGTFQAVAQTGGWFQPQVRLAHATGTTAQMSTKVGVGPVIMIQEQSIANHIFNTAHDSISPAIVPDNDRVMFVGETIADQLLEPGNSLTSASAAMANQLYALGDPNYCYTILGCVVSGSSATWLVDDGDARRDWANVQRILDDVYGPGSHVSILMDKHYNSDVSGNFKKFPVYFKSDPDGNEITLGNGIAGNGTETARDAGNFNLDHCFFDLFAPSGQFGDGVLRWDQTKFTHIFQTEINPAITLLGQMVKSDGTAAGTFEDHQLLWSRMRARIGSASVPWSRIDGKAVYSELSQTEWDHPTTQDFVHKSQFAVEGLPRLAIQMATYAMDAIGEITLTPPAEIDSITWAADGSSAVVTMTQPVTTNEGSPGPVLGFEIARAGQDQSDQSLDWRLPTASGVAATHTGTVTLGPGPAEVTITPTQPFANGDAIRFGFGGALGMDDALNQAPLEYWRRYLVTPDAQLVGGVPAMPQGAGVFVAATVGATPDAFGAADWSVADDPGATANSVRFTITTLPADNGASISALEYRVDGGAWTDLGGTATGTYTATTGFTDGVAADVELRAVNATGASVPSDVKSVTPVAPSTADQVTLGATQTIRETPNISTYSGGTLADLTFEAVMAVSATPSAAKLLGISGGMLAFEALPGTPTVRISVKDDSGASWVALASGGTFTPGTVHKFTLSIHADETDGLSFVRVWVDRDTNPTPVIDVTTDPARVDALLNPVPAGIEHASRFFTMIGDANGSAAAQDVFQHARIWLESDPAGDVSGFGAPHAEFAADLALAPAYGMGQDDAGATRTAIAPVNLGAGGTAWTTNGGPAVPAP